MVRRKKIKNKLIFSVACTLMVLIVCFGIISILTAKNSFSNDTEIKWDGVTVASSFSLGNGTKANPYLINNGEELAYFKQLIESNNSSIYNDKYYALGNNIDLDSHEWVAIGNSEDNVFKGYFDGRGYTIKNAKIITPQVISGYDYYGFFSIIDGGSIVNLNLDNLIVNPDISENLYKVGTVVGDIRTSGEISNISVHNSSIDLSNTMENADNMIGGFSASIGTNITFYNVYVGVDIVSHYVSSIGKISNTLLSDADYIINGVTTNLILADSVLDYVTLNGKITNSFVETNSGYSNGEDVLSVDSLILLLNDKLDANYTWDNTLRITSLDNNTEAVQIIKTFSFSASDPINLHDTGIDGNTIYINDLVSDYNYYMGLNYTDFSDTGTLPTGVNKNIYSDSNLVKIYTKYSGTSINDSSLTGYVSLDEQYSDFIYYKYYPVIDGYVTFELIDNPYADRPDNMAFNGWITDYRGADIYLDSDIYVRYVKIPVTDVTSPISITFYANWIPATTYEVTANNVNWSTVYNNIDSAGFKEVEKIPIYAEVGTIYTRETANRNSVYPAGALDNNGNSIAGSICSTRGGCTYYLLADSNNYDENETYYELVNGSMSLYVRDIIGYEMPSYLPVGASPAGYYQQIVVHSGDSLAGYYDSMGVYQTGGTCSTGSGCVMYQLLPYYDSVGNILTCNIDTTYYYLVTRDINIVVLRANITSSLNNTKPLTLTSINNGNDYRSSSGFTINQSYIKAGADLRIEWITLSSNRGTNASLSPTSATTASSYIFGNWYNFKIGRGIAFGNYVTALGVMAGGNNSTGTVTSPTRYRFVVESGFYNILSATNGTVADYSSSGWGSSGVLTYVDGEAIYGSDYDRILGNNDDLIVYFCAAGAWGGTVRSSSEQTGIAFNTNIKSGSFGTSQYDYSTGVYVGGRADGTHYAARSALIEGGYIYNLIGGPLTASNRASINDTYINIKGGSIDYVIGGAGASSTYGNRIINHTGGIINYSIFGGSNGYIGSDNGSYQGTLEGSTFIYIGGTAVVGDEELVSTNASIFGAEAGSVFGIGNGNSGSSKIGTANNSNIIIDGSAVVKRNVYGGGNYGSVGINSTTSPKTTIQILNGTVNGSVYGGGNNNGAGTSSVKAEISITMQNGMVEGSIYGGSRTRGTVYGSSNVSIFGGNVVNDIYGGGEGGYTDSNNPGTFVTDNINVIIGDNTNIDGLTINGSVYGGSAYGTVNGDVNTSSATGFSTNVTVNNGIIVGSVFGGGKGSSTFTPNVFGNVVVTINDGNIGNVYGGNDHSGSPSGNDYVYLNGGIIGNAFGGGNNTGQVETNIYLQGSELTNLFGGSNASGTVDVSNVTVTSGIVSGTVYGGNNVGGTTIDTNVLVSGGIFSGDIYGGGSLADSTSSTVVIEATNINDVYGGGEQANVDITNVTINGATGGNVFGGSNISGDVKESRVLINSGIFDNVYGGNNQGGYTDTTNVALKEGIINSIYGGGDNAISVTSNVDIYGGTINNVFGGGNEAGLTTSNVNVYGGTINSVYGGSNNSGDITSANVYIATDDSSNDFVSVDISTAPVDAEDWQSTEFDTYVPVTFTITNLSSEVINNWKVQLNMPSDTTIFSNYSASEFTITDGVAIIDEINKYSSNTPNILNPGDSYSFDFAVLTNTKVTDFAMSAIIVEPVGSAVNVSDIIVGNVYGGNNMGGTTGKAVVDINAGDIGNVYGGGNEATVSSTYVTIDTASVDVVFGGGNAAATGADTYVDINNSIVNGNVYGGGNEGVVSGSTDVYITNTAVAGSTYAGGNGSTAIVLANTTITIDGTSVIGTIDSLPPATGSVFGSGNAAATGEANIGSSVATVNIVGATIYGNVYGGANTSVVYGRTITNIGTAAVLNDSLIEGDIYIRGTVFGGGEANASGSENYDFEFISVTDAIDIYIDGTDYITNGHNFLMNGSIFGSGNASSSSGTSYILIKNLGTRDAPSRNISIQRANTVVLDNSVVELSGTTDRTNDYSTIKYSFNRIDSLTIKNNTVLLLKENANLLKKFNSMVDVDGVEIPATVTIDDDSKTVTKNVDNRLYLIPDHNLNITTNQSATAYGKVTGMTFFGMYNSYDNGSFQYGVYDDSFTYGDLADAGDIVIGGSYVLGLHHADHDITTDGFYTNYLSEDYTSVTTAYIDPTPPEAGYYMWIIGVQAINYTVDLNASKYSSLGTLELSMVDFAAGNTTFDVIGFNSEGLKDGVNLVEPTTVPKVTSDPAEANKILGLAIKAETREWTSYGSTKFFTNSDVKYTGDTTYRTDSQQIAPSLMFYLYHAKNIIFNEDIGTVVISLQAATPKNEIESDVQLITITVNITATDFADGDFYDASITYDKKYEMPSSTSVNITNQSQFTAYYSIFSYVDSFEDFYGRDNDNYHALVTNSVLPVGTQITMIDIGADENNPQYYYYTVDEAKYNVAISQLNTDGEVTYLLSDFIRMGSIDSDNTYDDALANLSYYSSDGNQVMEEFLFIFDFKETTTTGIHLNNSMLFELRNNEDRSLISVLGIRQNLMFYNTYDSSNVVLSEAVEASSNYLYYDVVENFSLATLVGYDQTDNSEAIINTNYESNSMGLNVEVLDNTLTRVSSSMLTGTNIMIDNVRYFADSDGVFRIKLAGKVANLNRDMYITTDRMLPPGTYTFRFTLFASSDGMHNSHTLESAYVDIPVTVVGSDNSIIVTTVDETKLIYGETGLNELGLNYNEYVISYNSVLGDPNVRINLYKRNIDNKDTTEYQEVPISMLFTNYFIEPSSRGYQASSAYEKMLNITSGTESILTFNLTDNLISGTYRVVFKLYDNNQLIEEEIKYVIVRKNVE